MIDAATVERILCWRQAGLTLSSISTRENVSISAIKQIIKKTGGISRGGCRRAILEKAKQIVVRDSNLAETIALAISASITDDINLARQIRDNASLMLEQLYEDEKTPVSVRARTLAAIATSVSVSQSIASKALNIDKQRANVSDGDDLPELSISGYTNEEMASIREKASMSDLQLAELEEIEEEGGNCDRGG